MTKTYKKPYTDIHWHKLTCENKNCIWWFMIWWFHDFKRGVWFSAPRCSRRWIAPVCTVCHQVFKNCSNLTVHRRSHTGGRPVFILIFCSKLQKDLFVKGIRETFYVFNNIKTQKIIPSSVLKIVYGKICSANRKLPPCCVEPPGANLFMVQCFMTLYYVHFLNAFIVIGY